MSVPVWLPALLGFLTAVGSISIDMYLPAFPQIARELGAVRGGAQITLATFFIGLAIGQLILGPLADRLGRKAPLVAGMSLYTLATIGCALSPGLLSFSIFRFLAALGGASSMVVPRAVVRDLANGPGAARMMAQLMLVMGVSPILAPALGGFVVDWVGWRGIFWVQAIYGVLNLSVVVLLLPDTLPPELRVRHGFLSILRRYGQVARDRSFLPAALMVAFASATLFAYLGGSPLVFETGFHVSPVVYGCIFGLNGFALIVASQLNGRVFATRFGIDRTLNTAVPLMLAATLYLSVLAVLGLAGLVPTLVGLFFAVGSLGCIFPNGTVAVMSHQHANAGVASALTGTLQFSIGAVSGMMVGELSDASPRAMALCMLVCACAVAFFNRRRPRVGP
jgi:DHA1 family bicyclomycin/chloramphenicol resistance-like MFS transporter